MEKKHIYLNDLQASAIVAAEVAKELKTAAQGIVFLKGDLGAGKTTLVQLIMHALGWQGRVKSPSYSLIEPYELADLKIYHLDLYRVQQPQELYFMGLHDLLAEKALFFIEWPERLDTMAIEPTLTLCLEMIPQEEGARQLTLIFH